MSGFYQNSISNPVLRSQINATPVDKRNSFNYNNTYYSNSSTTSSQRSSYPRNVICYTNQESVGYSTNQGNIHNSNPGSVGYSTYQGSIYTSNPGSVGYSSYQGSIRNSNPGSVGYSSYQGSIHNSYDTMSSNSYSLPNKEFDVSIIPDYKAVEFGLPDKNCKKCDSL